MPNYQIPVIIETIKGSSEKYDYDPANASFYLKKKLPAGMHFPFDFGFIPGTTAEDGDPVDVMIISEFSSFTGCRMECRLIGGLLARQTEKKKKTTNNRFYAIPEASQLYQNINSIKQLPRSFVQQLSDFFVNYNRAEGKTFTPVRIIEPGMAIKLIKSSTNE